MNGQDLDTLLAAPLADIADDGFSRRVVAAVGEDRKRRAQVHALIELGIAATILAIAPFTGIGQTMEHLGGTALDSPMLLGAVSALALGWLAVQFLGTEFAGRDS